MSRYFPRVPVYSVYGKDFPRLSRRKKLGFKISYRENTGCFCRLKHTRYVKNPGSRPKIRHTAYCPWAHGTDESAWKRPRKNQGWYNAYYQVMGSWPSWPLPAEQP